MRQSKKSPVIKCIFNFVLLLGHLVTDSLFTNRDVVYSAPTKFILPGVSPADAILEENDTVINKLRNSWVTAITDLPIDMRKVYSFTVFIEATQSNTMVGVTSERNGMRDISADHHAVVRILTLKANNQAIYGYGNLYYNRGTTRNFRKFKEDTKISIILDMRAASSDILKPTPEFAVNTKFKKLKGGLMLVRFNNEEFQLVCHSLSLPLNFAVSTFHQGDKIRIVKERIQGVEGIISSYQRYIYNENPQAKVTNGSPTQRTKHKKKCTLT